jgi:hypothetical protein
MTQILYGFMYDRHKEYLEIMASTPELWAGPEFYELSRGEAFERSMKMINKVITTP